MQVAEQYHSPLHSSLTLLQTTRGARDYAYMPTFVNASDLLDQTLLLSPNSNLNREHNTISLPYT